MSRRSSQAILVLQLFALMLFVIPSDTVIPAIGAAGYPAALVGLAAFAAYGASIMLGLYNPLALRHPIRPVLCLLWLSVLASYVLMDRGALTTTELAGADRLLLQLAVITAVALIAAEFLGSLDDIRRVLRVLCWAGAFCGVVAALQFWVSLDLARYLRELPGFSLNANDTGIGIRDGLNRVSGTATYPIELGVVAGMLIPLAVYLGIHDTDRSLWRRWTPAALIGLGVPVSVSRSAVLAAAVGLGVLVLLMPAPHRLVAICAIPFAFVAVFLAAPGVISTLSSLFGAGASDPSIASRVSDYPLVEHFVHQAPWFGRGGWTYMPHNAFQILDNQFLQTAVELGLFGLLALTVFLVWPAISALAARGRSSDPELRLLCAALAGSALAAAVGSLTFTALSYPMFAGVYALVIGLIGAGWRLAPAPAPVDAAVRAEFAAPPAPSTRAVLPIGG
jgi:O-Antigen ligase